MRLTAAALASVLITMLPIAAASARLSRTGYRYHAHAAIAALDTSWGEARGWIGINAWQRFVIADALTGYIRQVPGGDVALAQRVAAVLVNRDGLDGNDDDLWAVLATLRATTADTGSIAWARATFDGIVAKYWDKRCGGGLWWDHARTYKNAITNALLIDAAGLLYQRTGVQAYREWARRGWAWYAAANLIDVDGLVQDGLDAECFGNHGPPFTYNQGEIIGGLVRLSQITGDSRYRSTAIRVAFATIKHLATSSGILQEANNARGRDAMMFKGIFVYQLGYLVSTLPEGADRRKLSRFLRRNADRLWQRSHRGSWANDESWAGQRMGGGAAAQASGIDLLVAAGQTGVDRR